MSATERGYPLTQTDNAPYPDGYAAIVAKMDTVGLESQRTGIQRGQACYFTSPKPSNHNEYDIEQGDIVFTMRPYHGRSHRYAGGVRQGIPEVRSSLNGLNQTPNNEGTLSDLKKNMNLSENFFLDYVLAQLKIVGVAAHEIRLERDGERAAHTFAVQIMGVVKVKAYSFMPLGSLVRVAIPSRQMFSSHQWALPDGHDPAKIPLICVPVERQDVTNFGMRLMFEFVHRSGRDALEHARQIRRICAMRNFGYAQKEYALTCGILFVVQCLKNGLLMVPPPVLAGKEWNLEQVRQNLGNQPNLQGGPGAFENPSTVRTTKSAASIFAHGIEGGRVSIPPREGVDIADNVHTCGHAEEVGVILGKLTGLLEPPTVSGESVPISTAIFDRALYQAKVVGESPKFVQERAQITQMVSEFMRQMFICSGTADSGPDRMTSEAHEFGQLIGNAFQNYNGSHLARTQRSDRNTVRNVQTSTLYGKMLSAQLNAFAGLLDSFEQLMTVQRSFMVGRVLKQAVKGRDADILLSEGLS